MPFLIRIIAQRLLIVVFSGLAFFGLDPDLSTPTPEIIEEIQQRQQERINEVFAQKPPEDILIQQSPSTQKIKEVEKQITDIQRTFTEKITEPVVQKIEEEIPVEVVQSTQKQTPETELLINSFDIKKIVVNIMCLEKTSAYTKLSSGSGVIISDSGIVLTNAHVAYPLLFSKQFGNNTYTCSIRRSDLPSFGYNAELIYYPVDWLSYNSEIIKDPTPIGTGENDYALVAMTSPISLAPSSTGLSYASTAVSYSDLRSGSSITVSGYPSTNSGVFEVDVNPGLKTAQTYIDDFFTFASKSFDILKTGVNQVAQRGSSGGGVFKDDKLYGIVVTTNQSSEGAHLNALTIPYIKRDFKNDTGTDFDDFILTPISTLKAQFITSYQPRLQSIISGN